LSGVATGAVAITAVAVGLAAAAKAAKTFASTVESQTNELAGFSGPLSSAQAQTQIRREFSRLRRAQAIGPELARAERVRAQLEERIFDINTQILAAILGIIDKTDDALNLLQIGFATINPTLGAIFKQLRDLIATQEENQVDDIFNQQFRDLMNQAQDREGNPIIWPDDLEVPQ
jgi:hypothetical protein